MNLIDCYRALGLRTGAPFADVKAAYRRLARRYHPDVNPGDQQAKDKFIELTEAYRTLSQALPHDGLDSAETSTESVANSTAVQTQRKSSASKRQTQTKPTPPKPEYPEVQKNPNLSKLEQKLKQDSYNQLQTLLKYRKFPRAIALVEGLAQRIPNDDEVRQWQAITYQRWGRQLINDGQFAKAQIYLKKALQTDPYNKSLHQEVNQDFQRLKQVF
ncbi:MAG: J domain-containing protein [Thainema sp.]